MEDKIIEAIHHVRNLKKQRVTKERSFNAITKTNTSIDQSQLMESFESTKDNGVFLNKPKGKRESYFVINKNNNSWIISGKSSTKTNTVTFPNMKSTSSPNELSLIGNSMLIRKKQQPSKTQNSRNTVTPKTSIYKTKEVSKTYLFSDELFLQKEKIFLRKELSNKQRINETLQQLISENHRPIYQIENTTFNNVINKDVNMKYSKNKSTKYVSPSKLINENTMEKSALAKEKINIQINNVSQKKKK